MRRIALFPFELLTLVASLSAIDLPVARGQPMPPQPLTLEVSLFSGQMRILASPEVGLRVNAYSVTSLTGSLHPGRPAEGGAIDGDYNASGEVEQADLDLVLLHWGEEVVPPGWTNDLPMGAIDQAELDGVLLDWGAADGEGWLAGNLAARGVDRLGAGAGEGWEVLTANEDQLSEAFLFGDTHFEPGRSESIGEAFDIVTGIPDIAFHYSTVDGTEVEGLVAYLQAGGAASASIPEPCTIAIVLAILLTVGVAAAGRRRRQLLLLAAMGYVASSHAAMGEEARRISTGFGDAKMENIDRLAEQLRSDDLGVRRAAAESLARCGSGARGASVELALAAADSNDAVREAAVAALEDLGRPRPTELDELAALLASGCTDTAYWAATLIGRAGGDSARLVKALETSLQGRHEGPARERIVWALGEIGPPAAAASASIRAAADAANCPPRLARLCRDALQSIGGAATKNQLERT